MKNELHVNFRYRNDFLSKKNVNLYINKCQFENSLFPITYLHNVRPKKKKLKVNLFLKS